MQSLQMKIHGSRRSSVIFLRTEQGEEVNKKNPVNQGKIE